MKTFVGHQSLPWSKVFGPLLNEFNESLTGYLEGAG